MVDQINTQVAYATPSGTKENLSPEQESEKEFAFFGDNGFTFLDFVDMVNPLQHIPVISTAYREITGDQLDPGARLAGGTLFGGPIGLAASAFNVILEHNTGKDTGEHVLALFKGEELPQEGDIMVAQNDAKPTIAPAGFAPFEIPQSEMAAFQSGDASLRLADLQEFMNPNLAKEVPVSTQENSVGAGSAGTWQPPLNQVHPFPTERDQNPHQNPQASDLYRAKHIETVSQQSPSLSPEAVASPVEPAKNINFQAKQSHLESIDALRAFAHDMKAQQQQDQVQEIQNHPLAAPAAAPQAMNTAQLSQVQDNNWFTQMISQNMERYEQTPNGN